MQNSGAETILPGTLRLQSTEEFMESARQIAGLSDFGDPFFQEPLRRFLESCERDAALNSRGLQAVTGLVTKALVNRLRFEDYLQRYPEILDIEINNPLIIIGLPRVGSTKLYSLLAANTEVQSFKFWQLLNPAPFPNSSECEIDPRITFARGVSDHLMRTSPDFFAGYIPIAENPEEDHWLFDLTFMQYSFILTAVASSYSEWLHEQDMRPAFNYVKRLQQFMIWQNGTQKLPLILKSPTHTLHLDILAEIFPGAKFVQPHRNPIECVASVMKLLNAAVAANTDFDHADQISRLQGGSTIRSATRGLELRKIIGEERFLDVYYEDIRNNPVDVVRTVYKFWGLPIGSQFEQAVTEWERNNQQHKYGKFLYSLNDSKISPEEIVARTRPYLQRFFPELLH